MQRKRANRKQTETTSGGEIEATLYFPGISQKHQGLDALGNRGTERQIALGVPVPIRGPGANSGSQCRFNPSKQPRQHSFCLLSSALTLRCQAFCLQTGCTVYALHPKDEPGRNLRSAVNHQASLLPKTRKHLIMCFQLCQRKGPCPVLILFGSQK